MAVKVKMQNVRLSFPDLWEAVQYQGQGPFNYRASFLFAKDSQAFKAINAAIEQAAKDAWGAKASALLAQIRGNSQKCCLVDGNTKAYDGYADNWVLAATRKQEDGRPLVLDGQKAPLVAADGKPYAGCYVNANVEVWAQDNSYGKAIRASLLGVQFAADGDAFGGGTKPSADDFDDLEEGAGADALA